MGRATRSFVRSGPLFISERVQALPPTAAGGELAPIKKPTGLSTIRAEEDLVVPADGEQHVCWATTAHMRVILQEMKLQIYI